MKRIPSIAASAAILLGGLAVGQASGASDTESADTGTIAGVHATAAPAARSMDPGCTFPGGFDDGFADLADGAAHEAAVDCIVYWQVTGGISPGVYNPTEGVSRGQMASFIARFVERSGGTHPEGAPNAFGDDDGTVHEANINKLTAAGIATGRASGGFDPEGAVTRSQMATFIVRGLEHRIGEPVGGSTVEDYFADDADDPHEANINKAASLGIATGTGGSSFAPGHPVRRDQMASFLARGLAELVDRATTTIPDRPPPCALDAGIERTDSRCQLCPFNSAIAASDVTCVAPEPPPPPPPPPSSAPCHASYPDFCIPPGPPDLNCGDISGRNFTVVGADPHRLDGDNDGVGCES